MNAIAPFARPTIETTPDGVTILTAHEGILAKVWPSDASKPPVPAANATWFASQQCQVRSLAGLAALLRQLAPEQSRCIVRAAPFADVDASRHRRTLRAGARSAPDLGDVERQWFAIDADGLHLLGFYDWSGDWPARLAAFVRSKLPSPLCNAACVVEFSASAFHPTKCGADGVWKISAHIWFWMKEPRLSAVIKAWLESLGCERGDFAFATLATLSPVQIHFTAAPILEPDAPPCPIDGHRIIELPGEQAVDTPAFTGAQVREALSTSTLQSLPAGWAWPASTVWDEFVALLDGTGALRSKGAHLGRPERLAFLDIAVNEFGLSLDEATLLPLFERLCVGGDDPNAESDFAQAWEWARNPNGKRVRVGGILDGIRKRHAGDAEVLATCGHVLRGMQAANVANDRAKTRVEMIAEARARGVIGATPAATSGTAVAAVPAPGATVGAPTAAIDPQAFSVAAWERRTLPPVKRLLGSVFVAGRRVVIAGPTGIGKTNFALHLGGSVAVGAAFVGWEGRGSPSKVLYVDGEMPAQDMKDRLATIREIHGGAVGDDLIVVNRDLFEADTGTDLPPLNSPEGAGWFLAQVKAVKPDLVILDSAMCLFAGELSKEETWELPNLLMQKITALGCCLILLHHTGRDHTHIFGSSRAEFRMDSVAMLRRVENASGDGAEFVVTFDGECGGKARSRGPSNWRDYADRAVTLGSKGFAHRDGSEGMSRAKPKSRMAQMENCIVKAYEALSLKVAPEPNGLGVGVRAVQWSEILDHLKGGGWLELTETGKGVTGPERRALHDARLKLTATARWEWKGDAHNGKLWRIERTDIGERSDAPALGVGSPFAPIKSAEPATPIEPFRFDDAT
jgi:KaiC/GvpD/RAD55 family RecA-like ATPase